MKQIDDAARLAAVVFAMKQWEWFAGPSGALTPVGQSSLHVPDEAEIAETIRELVKSSAAEGGLRCGTGRLNIEYNHDFQEYEISLEIGRLRPSELWTEEGIDHFVKEQD